MTRCICHPSRRCGRCLPDLAGELAERNDRCGEIRSDGVCLRPKQHSGDHDYEPLRKVIPFE